MQSTFFNTLIVSGILSSICIKTVNAAQYLNDEMLAPESAEEANMAMGAIADDKEIPSRQSIFNLDFSEASPFWRDSESSLNFRLYDFDRDSKNANSREAIALGTEISFNSGKWRDRLSINTTWHISSPIDAPHNLGNTGILEPDQSSLSVLSHAYLEYSLGEFTTLSMYRQDFDLPYINRQDSRMIPNTHEGYVVKHSGEVLQIIAGHITKMKKRDSEDFIPMSQVAGANNKKNGTSIAGAQYSFINGFSLGSIVQHTEDLFTTLYSEASYSKSLTKSWGLQLAAQRTDQRSVGREESGNFDTYSWGVRSKLSYQGAILTTAITQTGNNASILRPFGGTPSFTGSMLSKFDSAGEQAWRLGLSQNFSRLGAPGISLAVDYTKGKDIITTGMETPFSEENVIAVTADFRPQQGIFEGFWLRVRYADADRPQDDNDLQDLRIILSFSFSVFN